MKSEKRRFCIKFSPGQVNFAKFQKFLHRLVCSVKMRACTNFGANRTYEIHLQILSFDICWKGKFCEISKTPLQACSSVKMRVCIYFGANRTYGIHFTDKNVDLAPLLHLPASVNKQFIELPGGS